MTTTVDGIIGVVTTGNVTANNFFGNIDGNTIVGNITTAGNITGFNVSASNQVYIGPLQLRAVNPTTFGVFQADGVTQANIDIGNVDASQITQGTSVVAFDAINGNTYVAVAGANVMRVTSAGLEMTGDILPTSDNTFSLGNSTNQWKDLWVAGNTIYVQQIPLTMAGAGASSNLQVNGANVITQAANGNTTLANLVVSGNTNIDGRLVVDGNISGSNLYANGDISSNGAMIASGNIVGANFATIGNVNATGNVSGSNITTAGNVTATGNVSGNNIIASGDISGDNVATAGNVIATGNVSGANITASGDLSGGNINTPGVVVASGNITGRNFATIGNVVATGNISGANILGGNLIISSNASVTGNIITGGILTDNYYYANGVRLDIQSTAGSNTQVQFNNNGNSGASAAFTFDSVANVLTVGGNISVGNVAASGNLTSATLTVSANASVGNLATAKIVASDVANVNSLIVVNAANIGGTANVVGDLAAGGDIDLAGNLNIVGNISQVTAQTARIFGDAVTGVQALRAGVITGFANLATSVIQASTNDNDYSQINQQNVNNGAQASADYVITANDGDDTNYFLDLGLAGSGWDGSQTNSLGNAVAPHDGYLYINKGNLVVGTETAGTAVKILVGAGDNTGIVATFNDPGTSSTDTSTGALVLTGGLGVSGNLNAGNLGVSGDFSTSGNITATGNLSGGNIATTGAFSAQGNLSSGNITTAGNVVGNNLSIGNLANVGGNLAALGVLTDNYYYANGASVDFQQPSGLNTQLQYNNNGDFGANANLTFNDSTNVLTVGGNIVAGNIAVSGTANSVALNVTANANVGNLETTALVATGLANVSSLNVVGAAVVGTNMTLGGNINMGTGNIIAGNITLSGNINISGNITQVTGNSGQFFGNATTGLQALYAGLQSGYTVVPSAVFQMATNLNDYAQVNQQNINGGTKASADYVITADNGTDTNFFLDIGLAGSGWDGSQTNSLGNALAPNDGYEYVKDGNLVIGAASAGKIVKILSGASDVTGIVAKFNAPSTESTSKTSGALVLTGGLGVSGNVNAENVAATTFTGNLVGNVSGNISGNLSAPGANTEVIFNDAGLANATSGMIFNKTVNALTVSGNVSGANLVTAGVVAATGNVTGGNLTTAGVVAATGNVTGGNLTTAGVVAATGNITGGNLTTAGVVAATGNVTGANIVTAGNVYAAIAVVANTITGNGGAITVSATGTNQNVILDPSGTGVVSVSTARITNLSAPIADTDAATKAYVDGAVQGLNIKSSCQVATAAALPAYSYNNGTAGVGATITALAVGVLTVDGFATVLGERILVKNEVGGLSVVNGIYSVTTEGTAGAAYVLTRTTDFDLPAEIPSSFTFIIQGSINADTGWVCTTNSPVTIGATPIVFSQFSGAGSYSAGSGIALNGGVFSANVDGVTTAIVSGNIAVPTGAVLTNPNITAATGTSITLTGNANVANLNATSTVTAPALVSNIATGTAPLTVTSTTRVANLNVTYANVSDFGAVTTQSTGVFFPTFVSSSSTGNLALASNSALSFNAATGALTSTLLGGTLSTAAQPNVTSVGTLTTLTVSGNASAGNIATLGAIAATGNVSAGNLTTGGLVLATGNVTGGNLTTSGIVSASGNVTSGANVSGVNFAASGNAAITGNISAGNASITANISTGNISASGQVTVTGNITTTGGFIVGDGGFLSNLTVGAGTAIVNGTSNVTIPAPNGNIAFNINGAAAGRISVTSVAVGVGAGAAGGFSTAIGAGAGGTGQGSQGVAIGYNAGSSGQGAGAVAIGALAGQTSQAAGSIAINASGSALSPTGAGFFVTPVRADSGNIATPMFFNSSTGELTYAMQMALTGNITAANIYANSGTIGATTLTGTLSTAVQTNITSVGTLDALTVTANVTAGNVYANSGTIGAATLTGTLSTAAQTNITSVGTLTSLNVTANVTAGNVYANAGTIGAATLTGTLSTAAQTNITSVGTLTSLNVTGTTAVGSLNTTVLTTGSSGTAGTITGTWSLGAGSTLQATYSDLGERYSTDVVYEPGTVLMIGGTAETTLATLDGKFKLAGIVSTEPAYVLNADLKDSAIIALAGRVPCKVVGKINKGDILTISDIPGVATAAQTPVYGTIIARALESYDSTIVGVIEVKVDRG